MESILLREKGMDKNYRVVGSLDDREVSSIKRVATAYPSTVYKKKNHISQYKMRKSLSSTKTIKTGKKTYVKSGSRSVFRQNEMLDIFEEISRIWGR